MRSAKSLVIALLIVGITQLVQAEEKVTTVVTAVQIFGTIDPAKVNDYTEYMAIVNLYDALTTVDPDGKIVPQLAESWKVGQDRKTYTFKLKSGATFQDGSPVEAKDVVYSLKRMLALNQGPAHLFTDVIAPEAIREIDPRTVEIKLSKIYAPFLASTPLILVVNSDLVKQKDPSPWSESYVANNSAGAGPYQLVSWTRGANMILRRYQGYHMGWTRGRPIDEIRFTVTRDEATVKALATRGELGLSSPYQTNETYDALEKLKQYKIIRAPSPTAFYIKLNQQVAPTNDIHIRRAIALATDYQTIREAIYPGGVLTGPLAPAFKDAYLKLPEPEFNLEKAKAEIAKSSYAGKQPIKLVHTYVAKTPFEENIALLMKSNLDSIGFDVEIRAEPWNRVTDLASSAETTPATTQVFYGPTYPSPDSIFYVQYHSQSKGTWASMEWLQNKELDGLIDRSRETIDDAERNKIYQEIQKVLYDMQSDVYLATQTQRYAANKCLQGYQVIPMQSWSLDFSRLWWDCEAP